MSQCSDCYTGCAEIVSDRCIKYTGVDVPLFDIQKGDSLSYVEQALITFLAATVNGTGITIDIDDSLYCELVTQYLQECETVTALDLFKALVQAACNIQGQIDDINEILTTLNADYDVDCLDDVTNSSDTHAVLQAVIVKLCSVDSDLAALALNVETNYVQLSELNSLIAEYIASTTSATRYNTRMVPYTILPYAGSLSNFDGTGAGITGTEWEEIYLCNGQNGTPDLRGRGIVGAINSVPGGALSSVVDPAVSAFNPSYSLGTLAGANSVTLTEAQLAAHSHTASVNDPGHTHEYQIVTGHSYTGAPTAVISGSGATSPLTTSYDTSEEETGITVTVDSAGSGEAHANIQPVYATYFIMYIPT
jgi:microcystin-dependent protein